MKNKKKIIGVVLIIVAVSGFFFAFPDIIPAVDDAKAPVHSYISGFYIENSIPQTGAHNIVTAVLADYRGFDTLFETCVMFLSSTAKVNREPRDRSRLQKVSFSGTVIDTAFRIIIPIIVIYAFYVLAHGESSLGGGFQAGALLAIAYTIDRIIPSFDNSLGIITEEAAAMTAGVGVFIYILTGILPMFNGGNFLEYGKLPFAAEKAAELHSMGIIMIEIGVVVCVMATIINILEVVLERTEFDE